MAINKPPGAQLPRPLVQRLLWAESLILVLVSGICSLYDEAVSQAILLAGACYLLPQAWFAWNVFRYAGAKNAKRVAAAFYRGEAGKFVLSCALFAIVFTLVKPLNALAFFVSYAAMHVIGWVALIKSRSFR